MVLLRRFGGRIGPTSKTRRASGIHKDNDRQLKNTGGRMCIVTKGSQAGRGPSQMNSMGGGSRSPIQKARQMKRLADISSRQSPQLSGITVVSLIDTVSPLRAGNPI